MKNAIKHYRKIVVYSSESNATGSKRQLIKKGKTRVRRKEGRRIRVYSRTKVSRCTSRSQGSFLARCTFARILLGLIRQAQKLGILVFAKA